MQCHLISLNDKCIYPFHGIVFFKVFIEMKSKVQKTAAVSARKTNPVVHFELPTEDRKRTAKFYKRAFGWESKMLGEENGNYTIVTTASEVDKTGRPRERGIINGGFYEKSDDKPAQYPSVVIAVDDIKKSMKKVEKAGGKVLGEPMEVPGYGLYVSFYDTEGNRVSMMQPVMKKF
jgi:uncharacterized protein